jgi:hypothetical protein
MKCIDSNEVEKLIKNSPPGKNTKFLSAAHNLWFRFKNYDKCPPTVLENDGSVVSLIFATYNRDGYANLYEIVTIQGNEGKGYATKCWDNWIEYAFKERGSVRLKLSCTPSSVTWHCRNGLLFWAVDPSGSLRSDQPLFPTRSEQIEYRNRAINNPSMALPPAKVREKLILEDVESYSWSVKKRERTLEAIAAVGDSWIRPALFNNNLETFLS